MSYSIRWFWVFSVILASNHLMAGDLRPIDRKFVICQQAIESGDLNSVKQAVVDSNLKPFLTDTYQCNCTYTDTNERVWEYDSRYTSVLNVRRVTEVICFQNLVGYAVQVYSNYSGDDINKKRGYEHILQYFLAECGARLSDENASLVVHRAFLSNSETMVNLSLEYAKIEDRERMVGELNGLIENDPRMMRFMNDDMIPLLKKWKRWLSITPQQKFAGVVVAVCALGALIKIVYDWYTADSHDEDGDESKDGAESKIEEQTLKSL